MSENSVRGVGVQSGGEVHMQGSRVCANSQEGVFVSGARSQVTLLDNDIASNGTKGVGVQSAAAALLIGNRVQSNAEEGVFVSDPGSQVTVRDSNVARNGMKGIGVQAGGQAPAPPPPPPGTDRTRRVPHPVLSGHAASLTPY